MKNPTDRRGARCNVTTRLDPAARDQIRGFLARLGLPDADLNAAVRLRLTVAPGLRRVDFLSKAPFGTNLTLVAGPERAFWMNHKAKAFVALDRPRAPGAPPAADPSQPDLRSLRSRGPDAGAQQTGSRPSAGGDASCPPAHAVTVTDPGSGQSVRVSIETNPKWRAPETGGPLLEALVGGLDGEMPAGLVLEPLLSAIVEGGFPSSIRWESLDAHGEVTGTLSETRITGFEDVSLGSGDFEPPRGYRPWSLASKAPAKSAPGFTRMPPRPVDVPAVPVSQDVGVKRQGLDDDPMGRDVPDGPPPPPPPPPPRPTQTGSPRIGLRIEQLLLTHMSGLFNSAVTPIKKISIGQGEIVFDWLGQLRDDVARRGSGAPGTAVFQLLHDVALPNPRVVPPPTPASDFGTFRCRGLVDQMAIRDAEARFRAGTYPGTILQVMTPATKARMTFAGTNWDALLDIDKARLTFELIRSEYGALRIPFPTGTPAGRPAFGLVNFRADDIAGALTLPPLPPPTAGMPPFNPLLMLTAGAGGTITGTLAIGTLGVTATIARWPTADFWLIYLGGIFVAPLVPTLAWVIPIIGTLGVFVLTDVVKASITTTSLSASLTITFTQDATGVFVPTASCVLGGSATFGWASIVPTGIHQILALIEQGIMNMLSGAMFTALRDGIASGVTSAVRHALGAGFPATALRLGLPIAGGTRGGRSGAFTYLEASLDLSRDPRYQMSALATPTPLETAQDLDSRRAVPFGADYYGSLSMDQNFVNAALIGMRIGGLFHRTSGPGSVASLTALMPPPLPGSTTTRVSFTVESGPALTLDTQQAVGRMNHGTLTMGYVLTCVGATGTLATLRFRVDTVAALVLGSAFAPGEGTALVRIQTVPDRAFDVLMQSPGAVITPISLDLITTQKVVTQSWELDDRGKPHKVTEVDYVQASTSVPVTAALAQSLDPLLRAVVATGLFERALSRAPRFDGVPAATPPNAADPVTMFRYPLDDRDPDAVSSIVPHVRSALGLERGLAHFHVGLSGGLGLAFLPASAGSTIPMLATMASTFSGGILTQVKVRASTRSGADLQV